MFTEFFEVLIPEHLFNIGLKDKIHIEDGHAHVPKNKPGLGIELDWDFIDKSTLKVFD